jgi:transposase
MSLARLVIITVVVEGRAKSAVARDYGIARFLVQTLVNRLEIEGEAAFERGSGQTAPPPRADGLELKPPACVNEEPPTCPSAAALPWRPFRSSESL